MKQAMSRAARLHDAMLAAFPGALVEVVDESRLHAGHAGARPEGETHYRVRVVSAGFAGVSRVARSRAAHAAAAAEFAGGLHALALSLLTPAEAAGG